VTELESFEVSPDGAARPVVSRAVGRELRGALEAVQGPAVELEVRRDGAVVEGLGEGELLRGALVERLELVDLEAVERRGARVELLARARVLPEAQEARADVVARADDARGPGAALVVLVLPRELERRVVVRLVLRYCRVEAVVHLVDDAGEGRRAALLLRHLELVEQGRRLVELVQRLGVRAEEEERVAKVVVRDAAALVALRARRRVVLQGARELPLEATVGRAVVPELDVAAPDLRLEAALVEGLVVGLEVARRLLELEHGGLPLELVHEPAAVLLVRRRGLAQRHGRAGLPSARRPSASRQERFKVPSRKKLPSRTKAGMREPIVLEGGSTSDVGIAVTVLVPILVVMGCFGACFFMSTVQPCAEDPEKQGRKIR